MAQFLSPSWCGLEWSEWIALDAPLAEYQRCITRDPGFYRVRIVGRDALAYVGQTGRDLRQRTRALASHAGRSADEPPWNDPHTAAPGLWAWRIEEGLGYQVSVAAQHLSVPQRISASPSGSQRTARHDLHLSMGGAYMRRKTIFRRISPI